MNIRWNLNTWLSFLDSHIVDYPTPITLNYNWSFGSAAGISLVIQILSGVFLAIPIDYAFSSVLEFCSCMAIVFQKKERKVDYDGAFFRYFGLILVLVTSTLLWGFFASHSIALLLLGVALSYFSLSKVIIMAYPQSLRAYVTTPESWRAKWERHKGKLVPLLVSVGLSYLFCLNLFSFVEWGVELSINHYDIVLVLRNNPQLLLFVGLFYLILIFPLAVFYMSKLGLALGKRLKGLYWNKGNKRLFLFFRLYPTAKKDPVVVCLAVISLFTNTLPFFYPFVLWSLHTNQGVVAYMFYGFCMLCGLLVSLPTFQNYFFELYAHKGGLRMIGWNTPQQKAAAAALGVISLGTAYLFKDASREIVEGAVDRENRKRDDLMEERRQDRHNQRVVEIEQVDPAGTNAGKYKFAPLHYESREPRTPRWPVNDSSPSGSTDEKPKSTKK